MDIWYQYQITYRLYNHCNTDTQIPHVKHTAYTFVNGYLNIDIYKFTKVIVYKYVYILNTSKQLARHALC